MSAIEPGDFVESLVTGDYLVKGAIYRVARFMPTVDCWCDDCDSSGLCVTLDLAEHPTADGDAGFCLCSVRLIHKPKPDAFAHLLETPTEVREPQHV